MSHHKHSGKGESVRGTRGLEPLPARTSRKAVLVVDDSEIVGVVLTRFLEARGNTAAVVGDVASAAREICMRGPYDAVICDYDLPDGTGLDFAHWLRAQGIWIPVLMISGSWSPSRGEDAGIAFLQKPFGMERLEEVLDGLLGGDGGPRASAEDGPQCAARSAFCAR